MQKIIPCLWFAEGIEQAVDYYASAFGNVQKKDVLYYDKASAEQAGKNEGDVLTVEFTIRDYAFLGLNGGPQFSFTPAVSFFVYCKTKEEIDALYEVLADEILMPLDTYDFNEHYAFIKDKYGVSWQLMLSDKESIVPCLLFVGNSLGHAEAAVHFYTSTFKDAEVKQLQHYDDDLVLFSSFTLHGQEFAAMDGKGEHNFSFTEAISFIVNCQTQEEVDYYWDALGAEPGPCGWLKDKYGVSWQIVPTVLTELLKGEKGTAVMKAMLSMGKLDSKMLIAASK